MKKLTGGRDLLTVRRLYQNEFSYRPQFTGDRDADATILASPRGIAQDVGLVTRGARNVGAGNDRAVAARLVRSAHELTIAFAARGLVVSLAEGPGETADGAQRAGPA